MNRKTCISTGTLAGIIASLSLSLAQAEPGMLGKVGPTEFKKTNSEAGAKVKAIMPDGKKLSESDIALLKEVAMGGMMQLEVSKVAFKMASSEDVKMIAEAEIAEQTALGEKVKEIAKSGGAMLPEAPNEETMEMVKMLKSKSGLELDKTYLKESGIKGHEKLKMTMEKVEEKAENPAIKMLAATALPLIEKHLAVSKDESSDMK